MDKTRNRLVNHQMSVNWQFYLIEHMGIEGLGEEEYWEWEIDCSEWLRMDYWTERSWSHEMSVMNWHEHSNITDFNGQHLSKMVCDIHRRVPICKGAM